MLLNANVELMYIFTKVLVHLYCAIYFTSLLKTVD